FESSQIHGRVTFFDEMPVKSRGTNDQPNRKSPYHISLARSRLTGSIDLTAIHVERLAIDYASLTSGGLGRLSQWLVPVPSRKKWKWWRCPADYLGILASECQINVSRTSSAAPGSAASLDTIATEYGELRNAFAQVASAIDEENYCHYKFKDYARRARVNRLG